MRKPECEFLEVDGDGFHLVFGDDVHDLDTLDAYDLLLDLQFYLKNDIDWLKAMRNG